MARQEHCLYGSARSSRGKKTVHTSVASSGWPPASLKDLQTKNAAEPDMSKEAADNLLQTKGGAFLGEVSAGVDVQRHLANLPC